MIEYIELDSTYRDRTRYPNPAQFEVLLSQSGSKNSINAVDPVCLSAPKIIFNNVLNSIGSSTTITGVISSLSAGGVGASGDLLNIMAEFTIATNTPIETEDYYKGLVLQNTTTGDKKRILSSRFINNNGLIVIVQFTIDSAFSITSAPGNTLVINSPTDVTSDINNPQIFVPMTTMDYTNFYAGYFLYNETLSESRPISNFNIFTHLLSLNTSGSASSISGPVSGWSNDDIMCIRQELPSTVDTLAGFPTTTTVTLSATSSSVNNFYNGNFIRITDITAGDAPINRSAPFYEIRRIVNYNGTTKIATVSPPFSTTTVTPVYEILQFSYDNANPLNYTGSTVSQQQMICYEMELIDLDLPNQILSVGYGGRITSYQSVYVQIENVSSPGAGTNGVIYSNNPNSTRMLFIAPIDDLPNPVTAPFIKIDGDCMKQTVKFRPNDALRFTVYLENGQIFKTLLDDTTSPFSPNPLLQVKVTFSIKRIIK